MLSRTASPSPSQPAGMLPLASVSDADDQARQPGHSGGSGLPTGVLIGSVARVVVAGGAAIAGYALLRRAGSPSGDALESGDMTTTVAPTTIVDSQDFQSCRSAASGSCASGFGPWDEF
jgi:hypothetical protein